MAVGAQVTQKVPFSLRQGLGTLMQLDLKQEGLFRHLSFPVLFARGGLRVVEFLTGGKLRSVQRHKAARSFLTWSLKSWRITPATFSSVPRGSHKGYENECS